MANTPHNEQDINDTADSLKSLVLTLMTAGVNQKTIAMGVYSIGLELCCTAYGEKDGMDLAAILYSHRLEKSSKKN